MDTKTSLESQPGIWLSPRDTMSFNEESPLITMALKSRLLSLPPELIDEILSYLSPVTLARVSETCHRLREHANEDIHWSRIVNANLLSPLPSAAPSPTFKDLYASHHPLWFLVRNKIWFSDSTNTGKLILARYNEKLGRIEGYRLVARHTTRQFLQWGNDPSVRVVTFEPQVMLWLDDPVVQVDKFLPTPQYPVRDWRNGEVRMPMALEAQRVFSTLILCRKMSREAQNSPTRDVWPPSLIPSDERADTTYTKFQSFQDLDDKPQRLDEICESTFRVRRWIQFGGHLATFDIGTVMDGISTYSTLRTDLYTPTPEKPYQGIWVGDYSGHGSEFLLVMQKEGPRQQPGEGEQSSDQEPNSSTNGGSDGSTTQGSAEGNPPYGMTLEAVKLTGDPNVPRGEISFMADDIGPRGLIRVADEELFKGARVVRSRGQVAAANFRNHIFLPSELFLVSHDCLAHYWEELGHISFYRRIDIDELLQGR